MILAGSSPKACQKCGAAWTREVQSESTWKARKTAGATAGNMGVSETYQNAVHGNRKEHNLSPLNRQFKGWQPSCSCEKNDGLGRSIVLDPFAGSGTTCAVAAELGRDFVGVELNPEYIKLAEERIQAAQAQPDMFYHLVRNSLKRR